MGNHGAAQLKKPWIETPLVESSALSRAAGCRIFLKLENLQPSGSFKSRAMGSLILSHLSNPDNANRRIHFYASSGGNAGLAAVCAARSLSHPCTVVVPQPTKPLMVQKLRDAGAADVITHGETFAEAGEYMREVVMKGGSGEDDDDNDVVKVALHPFDDEAIWEGNSTIVDELAEQLPPPEADYEGRAVPVDAMICSVGGGGLLNGLVMGIERQRKRRLAAKKMKISNPTLNAEETVAPPIQKDIHLLATETDGTASLALAMSKKSLASLPKITSLATSLGAVRVSSRTLEYALSPPPGIAVHSVVLSDADAARGVLRLVDDERMLVEVACGVCVEAALGDAQTQRGKKRKKSIGDEGYGSDPTSSDELGSGSGSESVVAASSDLEDAGPEADSVPRLGSRLRQLIPGLGPRSRVVIVVCGGSNVTLEMAAQWRRDLECGWGSKKA